MRWGTRRKLLVFLIIVVFCAALAGALWAYLTPPPSCSDGTQNQDERGIDCGGSCARVCPFEVQPLVSAWVRVVPAGEGLVDVVAKVSNPNTQLGLPVLPYTLVLLTSDGHTVVRTEGETFVNPGETLILFAGPINVGRERATRAALAFGEELQWRRLTVPRANLLVSNKEYTQEPNPLLTAVLENRTTQRYRNVSVPAVLYDARGTVIAASHTFVDALAPDERRDLSYTWPLQFVFAPVVIDIVPRVNLFEGAQ